VSGAQESNLSEAGAGAQGHEHRGTILYLDASGAPVHVPGTKESNLPEAGAGTQGDEHQAVIGPTDHLNNRVNHSQ